MKKIFIITTALFLLSSCSKAPEYGKNVLDLNNFDFKLNLDEFSRMKTYFEVKPIIRFHRKNKVLKTVAYNKTIFSIVLYP